MDDFLRRLAAWTGGSEPAPDAELSFALRGFPTGGTGLLAVFGIVLAVAVVLWSYRRESHRLSPTMRVVLTVLRLCAVLFAILLLLEPRIVSTVRNERPGRTLILVDTSQSMAQQDSWLADDARELATHWKTFLGDDPRGRSRADLARAILTRPGSDGESVLDTLRERNDVRVYGFAADAEQVADLARTPEASTETERPRSTLDPDALAPRGRRSNLGDAVRTALERNRGSSIAGLVVLTDGRRNAGPRGHETARLLEQRRVPHAVVLPVGDPSPRIASRILRVDAPQRVFRRDPFEVRATVESVGHTAGGRGRIALYRTPNGGTDSERVLVTTRDVPIGGPDALRVEVEFDEVKCETAGAFDFTVELTPPTPEPFVAERHLVRTPIEVLGDSTRVLLVAGSPTHEYRILRNQLIRDRTIELSCWLQSADRDFPQDGNVSLDALPETREDLAPFDVLILLDPDPRALDRAFADAASARIAEEGMGLWWVCGEKFTLEALRATASTAPLAAQLPVDVDIVRAERYVVGFGHGFPRAWPYLLTEDGAFHKVTRLADDPESNRALWSNLPGFHFAFPVRRAKPAATVLVENPDPARLSDDRKPEPLIATHFVGAGRVLFTGTDEIHDWRQTEWAYDRFWVNGVRYLLEGRLGRRDGFTLTLSEERIELGGSVSIVVEATTTGGEPAPFDDVTMFATSAGGETAKLTLEPTAEVPGRFEGFFRPTAVGAWTVGVGDTADTSSTTAELAVEPAAVEKEGPIQRSDLERLAAVPGGIVVDDPNAFGPALDAIRSRTVVDTSRSVHPLWDTWITIAILLSLLSAEWWLRKRANLL